MLSHVLLTTNEYGLLVLETACVFSAQLHAMPFAGRCRKLSGAALTSHACVSRGRVPRSSDVLICHAVGSGCHPGLRAKRSSATSGCVEAREV